MLVGPLIAILWFSFVGGVLFCFLFFVLLNAIIMVVLINFFLSIFCVVRLSQHIEWHNCLLFNGGFRQ